MKWLDRLPAGMDRDTAVASFASAVADDDPEGAVAWAATIGDENQRSSKIQQSFYYWRRSDKVAAAAWLEKTTAISDSIRENLKRNRD